jgi:protein-S-isoprenylcysteine O-methyltransferase Ste14
MSSQIDARTERALQIAIDLSERLFVLVLFATFVLRISLSLVFRPYNLLVLVSEGLVVVLILIRRHTNSFTMRPQDWIVALGGTAVPMLLRAGGLPVLPPFVGAALMCAGLIFAIWAKLTLRQSFGIAAANRGPVGAGPYRLIRHPMYAGYIVVYLGFLLSNPLIWNLVVVGADIALIVLRIMAEERVLTADKDYERYQGAVRYRLLRGVF